MLTLSPTLIAHQKGANRVPAVGFVAQARRAGAHLLRWARWYSGAEPDSPHAAAVAGDGALLRARNDAGNLRVARVASPGPSSTYSTWTLLQAGLAAGSGVAMAARTGEALVVYSKGLTLHARVSADNGASWGAETLLVTEASAVGWVAAAYRLSTGNVCLFYNVGATVKRLRRTAGTWDVSGTAWTNSMASVSGIAAAHDGGDFALLLSGTAAGATPHRRVFAAQMGDGNLPANAWSALVSVAESDAVSTSTFAGPAVLALPGATYTGAYVHIEAGNVPYTRAFESHPPAGDSFLASWSEPAPHEAASGSGLALGWLAAGAPNTVFATTPSGVWAAAINGTSDLGDRLLRASVRFTPSSARAMFELDNADGALLAAPNAAIPGLVTGGQAVLTPGYASGPGGAPESGVTWWFTIDRVRQRLANGRRTTEVEASGPWERAEAWRAPQAWQVAPGTMTRDAIFRRIAARAGFPAYQGSGAAAPSADWAAYSPGFALAPGETGAAALRSLLAVVNDGCQADGNKFTIVGLSPGGASSFTYGGAGNHPVFALSIADEPPAHNWVRLTGTGRYADTIDQASVYQHGPRRLWLRHLDAGSNLKASAFATNALRRAQWGRPLGELAAPFQAGQQLFDVITVSDPSVAPLAATFRVLGLGLEYQRGPGAARYDSVITLGAV
ncbi:MAG: hypothetical protein ACKVT1_07230 [Dehalococcoidia bacterium]